MGMWRQDIGIPTVWVEERRSRFRVGYSRLATAVKPNPPVRPFLSGSRGWAAYKMAPGYRRFRTLGLMTSPARANIAAVWTRAVFTIRPHLAYLGTLHKEFALLLGPFLLAPRLTSDPQIARRTCRNDHTFVLTIPQPDHFSHGTDRWRGNAIGPEGGCLNAGASTSRITKG